MVFMLLLQKYRIFLKRVTEASSSDGSSTGKNIIEKTLRSSFATGHPSLVINALQKRMLGNLQITPSLGATIFSNQQASSSNPIPELGYGQSHSVDNSAYFQQPTFGNTSALYQSNGGGTNGKNPKQMYKQETQARSERVPDTMSKNNFPACGILGSNDIHDIQNMGFLNNSILTPNFNCNYSIADQVGFSGGEVSNGFNGSYDLIHENNGNMNSGYYSGGAYSPAGFGRTNQLSPRFPNVNQQENNPMLLSQQNNLGNGGDMNYLFDHLTNNTTPVENAFHPQFAESNLYEIFPNQQKNLSYNQQQGGGGFQDPGSNNGYPNVKPSWNQGANDDIDSVFGPGRY
eukprot:XP_019081498.1 PREDICTED: GATA zinc finger domain-containing protein 14-like [Vitis vinifera]